MARLRDLVDNARARLATAGIAAPEAAFDAELLMRDLLGWDRGAWFLRRDDSADPDVAGAFERRIARRAAREPVAYIRGVQEFYGREFQVGPGVLIPRPETELVVDEALALLAARPSPRVADIGTGSGCLAVTLALEFTSARVAATDISTAAVRVARVNAATHGVTERVTITATSLLDGVPGLFDLIVSNPPYVPDSAAAELAPEVVDREPRLALFGGADGLREVRAVVTLAATALAPGGSLVMEIGIGQWPRVRAALEAVGLGGQARVRHDLQDIPRAVVATRGT
ncbi:MAG: peptide chain release factor N(5)-glutamine methyltransferase [Acidobacteriota bacterium]